MRFVIAWGYYPNLCDEFKIGFYHFMVADLETAIVYADAKVERIKKNLEPFCSDLRRGCFTASLYREKS